MGVDSQGFTNCLSRFSGNNLQRASVDLQGVTWIYGGNNQCMITEVWGRFTIGWG